MDAAASPLNYMAWGDIMKIYDELTDAELTAPDESAGYLYAGQRVVRHVPEHDEILEGTDGWRHRIPAHDEYEACHYYHAYTEEEIEAQNAEQAERSKPSLQEQVDANAAAIEELAAMMAGGVT